MTVYSAGLLFESSVDGDTVLDPLCELSVCIFRASSEEEALRACLLHRASERARRGGLDRPGESQRPKIGDIVKHPSTGEVGVVVSVWTDEAVGLEAYVAFWGKKVPFGRPDVVPYVLRYATSSLMRVAQGESA